MSAVPGSTPSPAAAAPAPSTGTKILKAATDTLKLVVAMANTPGGLQLATVLLGTANPAILLVEQFGVRVLGPLLLTWAGADISDADVATELSTRGYKVTVYDPMAAVTG